MLVFPCTRDPPDLVSFVRVPGFFAATPDNSGMKQYRTQGWSTARRDEAVPYAGTSTLVHSHEEMKQVVQRHLYLEL